MPAALFGRSLYQRDHGNLPPVRLANFLAEPGPTTETGVCLQCRFGLVNHSSPGAGPIHGIFSAPGAFNGDIFTISGLYLYRENTQIGPILGTGPVRWAVSDTELVVTRGTFCYSYDGVDLQSITMPDGFYTTSVAYVGGLFLFVRKDSHKVYFSAVLDARTVESLDFFSAELAPDNLLDIATVLGTLYLFGEASTEPWFPSGNVDLPFTRIDQRLFGKGVISTGAVCEIDDALVIVGSDGVVYRIAGGPEPISHFGIEERIADSADYSCFSFTYEGHKLICVRLTEQSLIWDARTQEWTEFTTYGRTNWRAKCATNIGSTPYFGDDEDDDVWTFGTVFQDSGAELEGYFTAYIPIAGGTLPIDSLQVTMNVGATIPLSGDDASPVMEMRYSRDAGRTWTDWKSSSIGGQGEYRTRAMWRRLGMFDAPGAVFEFRYTDQSPRRVSQVTYNEAGGGRSR